MPLVVKICGLKTPDTLDAAIEAGADMVGFVFFRPSPRNLDLGTGRTLAARVKGRAQKVALSVDANNSELDLVIEAVKPDLLQLHGKETPERIQALKHRYRLPITKALPIETRSDLSPIRIYARIVDRLLFDARAPRDATRPGGLGKAFDWRLLEGIDPGVPYFLSGGLDVTNVAEALRITRAPAVDVSSGVERAPGVKDPEKIHAFVRAARQAAKALSRDSSAA